MHALLVLMPSFARVGFDFVRATTDLEACIRSPSSRYGVGTGGGWVMLTEHQSMGREGGVIEGWRKSKCLLAPDSEEEHMLACD